MINPQNVFVADARPALALPTQRCAYVFGAAHPLGEALLAQILARRAYARVTVSTTAPLPATVAHLHGALQTQDFVMQDGFAGVDCVFIVGDDASQPTARYGFAARSNVYAPLTATALPALLREVSLAAGAAGNVPMRWLIVAPHVTTSVASSWVGSYSVHLPCRVYGLNNGERGANSKAAYQFKPEGTSVLDRLGVWVLNTVSNIAHSMINPQQKIPLTSVKMAQRLIRQFESSGTTPQMHLGALSEIV